MPQANARCPRVRVEDLAVVADSCLLRRQGAGLQIISRVFAGMFLGAFIAIILPLKSIMLQAHAIMVLEDGAKAMI